MRIPTQSIHGNLRWTRSGTVWADWILTGQPYGLRPTREKSMVRDLHTALVRGLPGESLLLGVRSGLAPAAVVERMVEGVDLDACPDWAAECAATLDSLDELGPGQRIYWLSVPLGSAKPSDQLVEPLRAAATDFGDMMGLPRQPVGDEEIERRLLQASRIAEHIPAPFYPRPATPAQMVWLHAHMLCRGLFVDTEIPAVDIDRAAVVVPKLGSALNEPFLDEGGQTDLAKKTIGLESFTRRFLKVVDASTTQTTDTQASYQALMAVADTPDGGMVFPGAEVIGRVDESGLDVDWAIRLNVRASSAVAAANRKALRNLNEQFEQRDGEQLHGASELSKAAEGLAEYAALLAADKLEVEVQATMIFCVAAPTADLVRQQSQALGQFFSDSGYRLSMPLGTQEEMWWAMHPGVSGRKVVREFAQVTTSRAFSALVPFASVQLGDRRGTLLGLNIGHGPMLGPNTTSGATEVVLHDIEGFTDRHLSGSVAVAGELGAGKSYTLKKIAAGIIDRGGRVVVADRTSVGEYAQWARSLTDAVIVDTADSAVSMDPLRVFGPVEGARIAQSFLTQLLNVTPTSPEGVILSEALSPGYLAEHGITSLGALVPHMASGAVEDPGAREVARLMGVFARKDIGRVVFDPDLPTLDVAAKAVVFRTHKLELPDTDELHLEHLFRQMSLEKIFGRAAFALIAAFAKEVCFADPTEISGFVLDETHAVTISPEGERVLIEFIRDGRKPRAAVLMGSHDPLADFGSETLRGLVPTRILHRHPDKNLARNGLEWLGLDSADEGLLELVQKGTSPQVAGEGVLPWRRGEGLLRDASGNVGRIRVLPPFIAARAEAMLTDGQTPIVSEQPVEQVTVTISSLST